MPSTPETSTLPAAETGGRDETEGVEGQAEFSFSLGIPWVSDLPPKHILVVDDDQTIRELVAVSVARTGYRVDTAGDGEEGWRALCRNRYDLVITDHHMPRLSGLNMIKRLRSVSDEPPCILISGDLPTPESAVREIIRRGAVMAKPFSTEELIEQVYSLLLHGGCMEA